MFLCAVRNVKYCCHSFANCFDFFREALDDVDMILNELRENTNAKALTVKGDALYNLGNFEHALLNYHRALRHASTKVSNFPF